MRVYWPKHARPAAEEARPAAVGKLFSEQMWTCHARRSRSCSLPDLRFRALLRTGRERSRRDLYYVTRTGKVRHRGLVRHNEVTLCTNSNNSNYSMTYRLEDKSNGRLFNGIWKEYSLSLSTLRSLGVSRDCSLENSMTFWWRGNSDEENTEWGFKGKLTVHSATFCLQWILD